MGSNIVYHHSIVAREGRERLNKHKSVIIWFTGLSGSGKSTLAHAVEQELHKLGCQTFVLDGDNIRHGLSSDLDFTSEDRIENIRRVGEVAKLMMEAGIITMAAFISPFLRDREFVRELVPKDDFIEVYCKAGLDVCESRDVKGLYRRARAGEIKNYTGVDSPYEEPYDPELTIDTTIETLDNSVKKVISFLRKSDIFI